MKTFNDYSLKPELCQALNTLGFTHPTEVQAQALPLLLTEKNVDLHGQAKTGTGKTLAFGLPLIQRIDTSKRKTQGLILAPTRELVVQICQSLRDAAQYMDISIEAVYGGAPMDSQVRALKKGAHIVVGTPGRLIDHVKRRTLPLENVSMLVLDEADVMLSMDFKDDIDFILEHTPENRQIWLFSATVKSGIRDIMNTHMRNTVSIKGTLDKPGEQTSTIEQFFCMVPTRNRLIALTRFITAHPNFYGFIFCRTKILTSQVAEQLSHAGFKANALHGDMSQALRNRVIKQFKNQEFNILVATDVAARGIDVSDTTHVINYSLPDDQESYVHRVGRTGRAGKKGIAISFITRAEGRRIKGIMQQFKFNIQPIDVPNSDDIARTHAQQALVWLESKLQEKASMPYAHHAQTLIEHYTPEQLRLLTTQLLHDKFFSSIAHTSTTFTSTSTADLNKEEAFTEFFMTVGSDDGLTKQDIISYIEQQCNLDKGSLEKVKVIKRRTFVVVPTNIADSVMQSLRGKKLGGMKIRVAPTHETPDLRRNNNRRPMKRRRR